MQIKNVTPKDFADVLQINEDSLPHVSRIDTDEVQWFADNAAYFRVLRVDERLAGFLIGLRPGTSYASPNYRWFCDNYNDFAYVDRVAVADWARRRGIANSFYEDFAHSQTGVAVMTCEVNIRPPNAGSMQFHERQEFKRIGSQVIDDGQKEVAYLEKKI
ncbi:MAG: GNAT family N-acetyltransferase [Proteobacteria bacterium]|nr:GNAT family N-acetyltransferase [Pseudomonadota bacterium]